MRQAGQGLTYKAEHVVQVRVRDLDRDVVHPWLNTVRPPLGCIVSLDSSDANEQPKRQPKEDQRTGDGTLENQ